MDAAELKRLKEAFVSNLEGTTMLEISSLMAVTPVAIFLRLVLASLMTRAKEAELMAEDNQPSTSPPLSTLLDFGLVVMPTLYCMTHPAAIWPCLVTFTLGAALLVYVFKARWRINVLCFPCPSKDVRGSIASSRKPFLSKYRASMMLLTIIAILAVDFRIFPRRFGKAETYGTGLMDVGVGSFVVANGVVSREARNLPTPSSGTWRSVSPLLLLGGARLLATKGAGYQEHVGEYGVHWNFFFTLAAVELLTSIVPWPPGRAGLAGACIIVGYQAVLSQGGLNEVILANRRGASLLSQNKEGVASAFGYWALYLFSVQLGRFVSTSAAHASQSCPSKRPKTSQAGDLETGRPWWRFVAEVWGLQMLLWCCTLLADAYIERVSRRSCNLAYVLWMLAFNLQAISMFLTFDSLLPLCSCRLLDAIDFNLLPIFLLANILTGAINMSVNTLAISPAPAFCLLSLYVAVVSLTAVWLHRKHYRLTFW